MTLPYLRISQPYTGLFAYYDGRIEGYRFDPRPNWVDAGGLGLGIASFTLIVGSDAIVYDTGTTPAHGAAIADHLKKQGVKNIRIVYSHWHKDHIAGTTQVLEAFPYSSIIANVRTTNHLAEHKIDLESDRRWPPISPVVLPTETFDGTLKLSLGSREIELHTFNIHSDDASVLWLPKERILLAGDTLEDPITYVDEPQDFPHHLADLKRLKSLKPHKILPCHGAESIIASGGYDADLIDAIETYTTWLHSLAKHPENAAQTVQDVLADHFKQNHVTWFDLYADVHAANVTAALAVTK
jgi:glyoxylase-like metal-dependent hydrolase (beta-lactamase superfamily II)